MKKQIVFIAIVFFFGNFTFLQAQEIEWISIEDLEAAQANEPRKVIIDVYTDWCGWCKRMDKTTFKNEELVNYLNSNYYAVKLDGEDKDIIKFRGQEFEFVASGRRGYNKIAYELLRGKMSYPSIVFLDENLDVLQAFKGFRKAEELMPIIKYLGEDLYKNMSWTDYINESKGEK